ncbi:MAG: o-succinylbenzoate---CoA ligase [Thermoleophilaceae bacterium]|nr:o-succinylbenzoate---CoA ligase [Thermoleophilaceae bacterium]
MARRLAAAGVGSGDRVASTLPAGSDFAALLHALPRLGAVLVPLNTRLSSVERAWQVDDCAARLVVSVPVDGEEADVDPLTTVDPDGVQTLLYTSGTSGLPKAVELTYANHAASAIASAWNLGVDPGDRWLCVLPVFHVGGLAILLRSAIYGTTAVVHDGFDRDAVASTLASSEVTLVSLVATMLRRLRDSGLEDAPALRAALLGGGPVPRDLLEWAAGRGLPVLQTYGLTETASQVATLPAREALSHHGSAGRPLLGVDLRIGDDGEILVRGPMVARGALAADGWLHTGDGGHLDEDGFLHVDGRLDDTIVTGGENVAAAQVEDALLAHPAVADAAVAGRPDSEWGQAVTAWIVLATQVPDHELDAHCRSRLAGYKVPRRFVRMDELPRNAAGKVLRGRLVAGGPEQPR